MKIAMVFDGLQVGGVEKVGSSYAKLFHDKGNEVTIINLVPKKKAMEGVFGKQLKFVNLYFPRYLAPQQYAALVKETGWGKYAFPIISIILNVIIFIYKVYFFSFKDHQRYDLVIAFSGHFNDLTFVEKNFVHGTRRMCWLHGALYQYLLISDGYLSIYRKIKNLVVLVSDDQNEALMYNRRVSLNIKKIYNPISVNRKKLNADDIEELKKKYGKFIIMVARFSYPHKDQYTVIKALEILWKENDFKLNLLFVGSGPELENVKRYVNTLSRYVQSHIFFVGEQKNVEKYYGAAIMLVHSSIVGEGLPTVLLEAMANHLPIVSTDSKVGPREILGNDKYGLLCRVGDPEDMADKISKLYYNSELKNKIVDRADTRIKDFSFDCAYTSFIDFLKTCDLTGKKGK